MDYQEIIPEGYRQVSRAHLLLHCQMGTNTISPVGRFLPTHNSNQSLLAYSLGAGFVGNCCNNLNLAYDGCTLGD